MTLGYSPSWLLLYLLCALTLRGIWWIYTSAAKHRSMSESTFTALHQREKTVNRLTKAACFGVLCYLGGWTARDLAQFHHTYVINNVDVLRNDNRAEGRYLLSFGDTHQEFDTRFCADYIPQFPVGVHLEVLVYEDRGECWSISNKKLGYKIQRGELHGRTEK